MKAKWIIVSLFSVMIFFQPILPILSLLIVCFIATKQISHPILSATAMEQQEYERLLVRIKEELSHPLADSYHIIVSLLHYLLMTLNRRYSTQYHLPFDTPKNYHAFEFKQLLEKHIRQYQRVADYAAMLNISRITLNASVQAQIWGKRPYIC